MGVHTKPRRHGDTENEIGKIIVDCAVRLHQELGPGLLESVYEVLLAHELQQRGLKVRRQVPIPTVFHGIEFEEDSGPIFSWRRR